MQFVVDYLTSHLALTLFLCLGFGFLVGKIRIKSFKVGATIGTLLVGIIISQFGNFEIPDVVTTIFFSLFVFTIGFEVGPPFIKSFSKTSGRSGLKALALSLVFVIVGFGLTCLIAVIFSMGKGTATGLFAGALTQTAVIGASGLEGQELSDASVAYALTYVFGTVGVILYVKTLGPKLCSRKQSLLDALNDYVKNTGYKDIGGDEDYIYNIQNRTFVVEEGSSLIGMSIDDIEKIFNDEIEIAALFRGKEKLKDQSENSIVEVKDILRIQGTIEQLSAFSENDEEHITEISDPEFRKVKIKTAKIVVTAKNLKWKDGLSILSKHGVLLNRALKPSVIADMKRKKGPASTETANNKDDKDLYFKRGNIIAVSGSDAAIDATAKQIGYVKNSGLATDVLFMSFAVAVGLFIGYLSVTIGGVAISLGEGGGALLAGLLCGWWYEKHPRFGYIPASARSFIEDIGLNLFIAAVGLGINQGLIQSLISEGWKIFLIGIPLTLLPHIITTLVGKHLMKMETVDVLGTQCGCGTVDVALNALTEETGSSAFAVCYAPGCAMGEIFLTIAGILVATFI